MTIGDAKAYLKEHNISLILAQFVDLHGVPKAKAVPVEHLEMILGDGAGFAGFALWGYGMGPDGPDLMQKGDLNTLRVIPWLPGYARIACEGYVGGKPYRYDTRAVLSRVSAAVKEEFGYRFFTGLEPEFYLLKNCPRTGQPIPAAEGDSLEKPCYDYAALSQVADYLQTLVSQVRSCGMDVYQIDHEDANGQYEVNFTYDDAVTSADHYTLFKMAASTLAKERGLFVSFMPKPFADKTGNGMHMHISLGDAECGNLFSSADDPRGLGLSPLAYRFLAGVLHHAPALAAVACPTINSYKRLYSATTDSGATWAPIQLAYGDNNRTASVRVTGGHIEVRFPDSSANPYLLSAAILAAGMDGVRRELDPGEPLNRDLYRIGASEIEELGLKQLPSTLAHALAALDHSEVLREALGSDLIDEFLMIKRREIGQFQTSVTDWERNAYLTFH
jgi:glutamine synthetase